MIHTCNFFTFSTLQGVEKKELSNGYTNEQDRHAKLDEQIMNKLKYLKY